MSAFVLIWLSFSAQSLELQGTLTQGSLIRGQLEPGAQLRLNDEPIRVTAEGKFVLGFGRKAALEQRLTIIGADGKMREENIQLSPREYKIQRIEGIAKRIMKPDPDNVARAQADAKRTRAARARFEQQTSWQQSFIWPLKGPITGVYGSQRFYNGEPRSPHYGVDVAAPTGTTVVAPADGVITLVGDLFYSGGTVIIDHGFGVSSTFLHLSKMLVTEGQQVKQGDIVAEVGATGRVTGPHLDWRMNWFKQRVDPALLVPPMAR
ncbi:M23 family metallopeptidase [uncultured Ferrimonas sp.]|uniref:M23 family metallopeptidase n=1 Tax=uncultured Ferrimonas sp. TaxID=432640 RepID=UPI00262487AD|nr:M23 family metallopeptidase [uncultured Ferrimonas sp.]